MQTEKSEFEEVRKLILKIARMKNRLQELGVVKNGDKITSDYAKWFCSAKFGLELCDKNKLGYDALSKFGKRIQITSIIGSDINFETSFEVQMNELDDLLIVFINTITWMIDSVYKVTCDIVTRFLSNDSDKKFEWKRESRSLSLKLYPDEENTLSPII